MRLAIMSMILLTGMTITIAIILMFSFIVKPELSISEVHFILTTGVICFFVCCPIYYYTNFKIPDTEGTDVTLKLRFPHNIIQNIPTKVTASLCVKCFMLTIMFAFIGIMSGLLFIFIYHLADSQFSRSEYLPTFLNGILIAYCSGGISWYMVRNDRNARATTHQIHNFFEKRNAVFILICIWIILFSISVFSIIFKSHGIVQNIIVCICLSIGIAISIILINAITANKRLNLEIQDNIQLIGQLNEKNSEIENRNKILHNQKSTLFKKKRETINRICCEFSDKWESDKTRPYLLNTLKDEVEKLRSSEYKKSINSEFIEYYGDLFFEIRQKNIINPDDIYFLQLIIVGFSQKSISHILDIHPKNFYTKKYRLINKIISSDISNKEEIVDMIKH